MIGYVNTDLCTIRLFIVHIQTNCSTLYQSNILLKQMCLNFFHRSATSEPIISEPFLAGSIKVEESFYFLAIFTRGFYEALEEISGSKQVRDVFFPYRNSIEMLNVNEE